MPRLSTTGRRPPPESVPGARSARRDLLRRPGPALGTLLLALAAVLAGASAARADVLVSNFDGVASSVPSGVSNTNDIAQAFETGSHPAGYSLESIELAFVDAIGAADIDDLDASVWTADANGRPMTELFDLTNPASIAAATLDGDDKATGNFAVFTAPTDTTLAASTTYVVLLTSVSPDGRRLYAARTVGSTQAYLGETGAAGWSIADQAHIRGHDPYPTWGDALSFGFSFLIRVNGAEKSDNSAPTVANEIPDRTATVDVLFSYQFPDTTFADADTGDTLSYSAVESGETGLPTWLDFNATTRTFSGTPGASDVETLTVEVTASDGTDSVTDTFDIVVSAAASSSALISNIDQANAGASSTGLNIFDQAQAFTTGGNAGGYTVTGVEFVFNSVSADVSYTVGIWSSDEEVAPNDDTDTRDEPHTSLGSLTCPTLTVTTDDTVYECTTTGIDLEAGTTYLFVIDSGSGTSNNIWATSSDSEDAGGASGWSIENVGLYRSRSSTGSWTVHTNPRKIRVNGVEKSAANNAPTVATPISDQSATVGTAFIYAFPADTFNDADSDDLTYTATLGDDTALPTWLDFAADTRIFSGTPTTAGTLVVKVTASDGNGGVVSNEFDIVVSASCPAPAGRRTIWTGEVTVGTITAGGVAAAHGFDSTASPAVGALNDTGFTVGANAYTIDQAFVAAAGLTDGDLTFSLTSSLTTTEVAALRLHVCDTPYNFSDASHGSTAHSYQWSLDLDWSGDSTHTLHLSVPENTAATGKPAISGTATVGQMLTADTSGIMDDDGVPPTFEYQWIREDADGMNPVDIAGETASTYTLATADEGKRVKVKVSFTDLLGGAESRTSDVFPGTDSVAAASSSALVSNIGQPDDGSATMESDQAQAFTTGSNVAGYTVTGVDVEFDSVVGVVGYTVGIWSSDEEVAASDDSDSVHEPHTSLGTLSCPALVVTTDDRAYDCTTTGINLDPDTTYLFVVDSSSGTNNRIGLTSSDDEDAGGASGWSIGNGRITRARGATDSSWSAPSTKSLEIRVKGVARSVSDLPDITIEANRTRAAAWVHEVTYTLTRGGDTADALTVTVAFSGPTGHDWELTSGARREVTFAAGNATATLERQLKTGFSGIGFSIDATVSGTLTASVESVTGYDTSDTAEVTVTVPPAGEAQFVARYTMDSYELDEGVGGYTVTVEATARSTEIDVPNRDLSPLSSTESDTATNGSDYSALSSTFAFNPSDCALNSDDLVVCSKTRTLTIVDDDLAEGPERFYLVLSDQSAAAPRLFDFRTPADTVVSGAGSANQAQYPVTILDNDAGVLDVDVTSTPRLTSSGATTPDTYGEGEDIEVTVEFSTEVTVTGTPTFTIDVGGTDRTASYDSGSGSDALVFRYTVVAADADTDGISWAANALALAGGTITGPGGSTDNAELEHDARSAEAAHKVDGSMSTCPAPDFGTRRQIWTGEVTVGASTLAGSDVVFYRGFTKSLASGDLDDTDFTIGANEYTIELARVDAFGSDSGNLEFGLLTGARFTTAELAALRLHVCDTPYDFSAANSDLSSYTWSLDLDWSAETTVTLYLSLPANNPAAGKPTISGAATVGQTLTAATDDIADADGLPSSFEYQWVREDDDGSNPEDIAGETASTYTLAPADEGKKVKVRVSFTDSLNGVEARTSDPWPATGTVAAAGANSAPTVQTPIPDRTAIVDVSFTYAFPDTTFDDADGDDLTYTAVEQGETGLPAWLDFDATTRTFSGTPEAADIGVVTVEVTADDGNGGEANGTFDITVSATGTACPAPDFGTRRQIWTGTVTVGPDSATNPSEHGFTSDTYGALDVSTFTIGGAPTPSTDCPYKEAQAMGCSPSA